LGSVFREHEYYIFKQLLFVKKVTGVCKISNANNRI